MKIYVLDANAVIRYLTNTADWERVRQLFARALKNEIRLTMCVINWGEAIYSIAKRIGTDQAVEDLKILAASIDIVPTDETLTAQAATLKHHYKLGYADCFAAALALHLDATLVTADPEFERLGKRLRKMVLVRHNDRS